MTSKTLAYLLVSLIFSASLNAAEVAVQDNQGVSLLQLDFPDNDTPALNSAVGMLEANLIQLRSVTGMASGYLNMAVAGEWVVRNMVVLAENEYPYPLLSTRFNLGSNGVDDVTSLDATLVYSDTPLVSAPPANPSSFAVGALTFSSGGVGNEDGTRGKRGDTTPPNLNEVLFDDPTDTRAIFQLDHPNLEAADNQCYPMAIANSLKFLANTTDLVLPHSHVAGLKGDQSLVGQLATQMNRTVTTRRNGQPVNDDVGIQGKLKYLAANGLQDRVQTRHWGRYASTSNLSETVNGKTATSTSMGNTIDFEMIVSAMEGGEDCEAGYSYAGGGGHMIDLVAAGFTRGQPWMIESSDINQRSDSDGAGPQGFIFSHLKDSDKDDDFNLNGGGTELDLMVCQKYIPPKESTGTVLPPPMTLISLPGIDLNLLGTTDPAGHSCCTTPPPGAIDISVDDQTITLDSPSVPWLPFSFQLDSDGSFSASNVSTVAGFSNISNSISGTFTEQGAMAEISLGTQGGLPQGDPITWTIEIDNEAPWPWTLVDIVPGRSAAVRANGFRDSVTLFPGEPFSLGITLDPATTTGPIEWWVVAQAGTEIYSFDMATSIWLPGLNPANSGESSSVSNQILFSSPVGLPQGSYTFYFGVDDTVNGAVDESSLTFDSVTVAVP